MIRETVYKGKIRPGRKRARVSPLFTCRRYWFSRRRSSGALRIQLKSLSSRRAAVVGCGEPGHWDGYHRLWCFAQAGLFPGAADEDYE